MNCPHCKRPALSAWQKLQLGRRSIGQCRNCGKRVGVHGAFLLLALLGPMLMGYWLTAAVRPFWINAGILLTTLIICLLLVLLCVPLVSKE